jgi:hypothetical protein
MPMAIKVCHSGTAIKLDVHFQTILLVRCGRWCLGRVLNTPETSARAGRANRRAPARIGMLNSALSHFIVDDFGRGCYSAFCRGFCKPGGK